MKLSLRTTLTMAVSVFLTLMLSLAFRRFIHPSDSVAASGAYSNSALAIANKSTPAWISDGDPLFTAVLHDLPASGDAAVTRRRLQELATQLAALGRENAIATIRSFLATGSDAPTHLPFSLGGDGFLVSAPTLRVFVLDFLERLDRAAAAETARTILAIPNSADEWAIGLRSLAHGRPDETQLLATKLRELLHYQAWRASPSAGWLESFDVAVHLGGTTFVPDLAELMRTNNGSAVNHAAFLALDRLSTREPASALPALLENANVLQGREASRAGMLARADLRDASQRTLIEHYLLNSNHAAPELDAFAGVFPNVNGFVSFNLLTTQPNLTRDDIRKRDDAALSVVEAWIADPRFSRALPQLQLMRKRLLEFTRKTK